MIGGRCHRLGIQTLSSETRAHLLQEAGLGPGYFDLYTSTSQPMNVYSKYFAGALGYRIDAGSGVGGCCRTGRGRRR